jgi:hypothetical protein
MPASARATPHRHNERTLPLLPGRTIRSSAPAAARPALRRGVAPEAKLSKHSCGLLPWTNRPSPAGPGPRAAVGVSSLLDRQRVARGRWTYQGRRGDLVGRSCHRRAAGVDCRRDAVPPTLAVAASLVTQARDMPHLRLRPPGDAGAVSGVRHAGVVRVRAAAASGHSATRRGRGAGIAVGHGGRFAVSQAQRFEKRNEPQRHRGHRGVPLSSRGSATARRKKVFHIAAGALSSSQCNAADRAGLCALCAPLCLCGCLLLFYAGRCACETAKRLPRSAAERRRRRSQLNHDHGADWSS